MIVDCFTFFNEFEVLELRLQTLDAVIGRFVICEAPFTFRGAPKPLHLTENLARFERWHDRIRLLVYPGPPNDNPWLNEWGQRDYLAHGLDDCAADDLVLIGDCDEIPDPRYVAQKPATNGIVVHRMLHLQGYANRAAAATRTWPGTRALERASIAHYRTLSEVRNVPLEAAGVDVIEDGWHLSSLGGSAIQQTKTAAYSHAEFDTRYARDQHALDVHYEADACEIPAGDLPAPLRDVERWNRYLWKRSSAIDGPGAIALQHAHGCFAYVPADAASIAVLTTSAGAWHEAGTRRFGAAFAGVAAAPDALPAAAWIVVDGLERFPAGTLARLRRGGPGIVVFVANARSRSAFDLVLAGGPFPPGRALGRDECLAEIAAAGYRGEFSERIPNGTVPWVRLDPATHTLYQLTITSFTFAELDAGALHDFQSDAFVFRLVPADT